MILTKYKDVNIMVLENGTFYCDHKNNDENFLNKTASSKQILSIKRFIDEEEQSKFGDTPVEVYHIRINKPHFTQIKVDSVNKNSIMVPGVGFISVSGGLFLPITMKGNPDIEEARTLGMEMESLSLRIKKYNNILNEKSERMYIIKERLRSRKLTIKNIVDMSRAGQPEETEVVAES